MTRHTWAIIAAALFAGCAPFTEVSGTVKLPDQGLEVDAPEGWYQAKGVREGLLLTRDGLPLQFIRIERLSLEQELPHSKKKFTRGMSPHDAAEVEANDLRSNPEVLKLEVLENTPATVAGRPGFRLLCAWKTRDGLRLTRLQYGFVDGTWAYRVIYQAAARHYFDRDLGTFERVRESLRLL